MIKVLIVDDIPETRDHLSRLLGFEEGIDVAGDAGSGEEAITRSPWSCAPTSSSWTSTCPAWTGWRLPRSSRSASRPRPIIMMSVHGEAEQLKRSISAGAREFLVKPFSGGRVLRPASAGLRAGARAPRAGRRSPCRPRPCRRRWSDDLGEHQVIAVFSPKGGAGRTTIATNLALALQRETGGRVCLVDANLQFGDVGVLLNLNPKNRSMLDAVEGGEPDRDIIDSVVIDHSTGIRVLLAPPSPEGADLVTPRLPAPDGGPSCARAMTSWSSTSHRR